LVAHLLTQVVTLRPRLPHGTGGKHGRRRGFVGRAWVSGIGAWRGGGRNVGLWMMMAARAWIMRQYGRR